MPDAPDRPSMTAGTPDGVLIQRYLAGECTPAEHEQVMRWIARDPGRRGDVAFLQTLVHTWRESRPEPTDAAAAWAEVRAAIATSPTQRTGRPSAQAILSPSSGQSGHRRWLTPRIPLGIGIAAALVVAVGGSVTVWDVARRTAPQPVREFASANGSRTTVTLRDGSQPRAHHPAVAHNSPGAGPDPSDLQRPQALPLRRSSVAPGTRDP